MTDQVANHFSYRVGSIKDDYSERADETQMMAINHFTALVGASLDFYGADTGEHAFKVDDIIFKVLEDPEDGYRSCLGAIDYTNAHNSIFFSNPIAQVRVTFFEDIADEPGDHWYQKRCQGYRLVDIEDNHIWVEFGTDYTDDYYPYFIFRYQPKKCKVDSKSLKFNDE